MSKPILCLDFDGVCHSYGSGWKGAANIPDPAVDGLFEFLEAAKEHFDVQVFSSRSHQEGGTDAMIFWFMRERQLWRKRGGKPPIDTPLEISFPTEKPAATISIDDRALTFNGQWPDVDALRAFRPWNKRTPEPLWSRLARLQTELRALAEERRDDAMLTDYFVSAGSAMGDLIQAARGKE